MDGPSTIRLQRRRGEQPPDRLVVKRKRNGTDEDGANGGEIAYERKKSRYVADSVKDEVKTAASTTGNIDGTEQSVSSTPRTFHLSRPNKRKQDATAVATVVETDSRPSKISRTGQELDASLQRSSEQPSARPQADRLYKRPGRGAAVQSQNAAVNAQRSATTGTFANQKAIAKKQMNDLAAEMHQFALDELAKTEKPKVTAKPKLSASRAKALHQQRNVSTGIQRKHDVDVDMGDSSDGEQVYDVYVRAGANTSASSNDRGDQHELANLSDIKTGTGSIGFLVITEEDEELWENYIEGQDNDDSAATDDEDENAEDYYAADYPSDELASDDEYNRGAYGYRAQGGSDDEQYDQQTWSDEEEERMMNPFGRRADIPKAFRKYLDADRQRRGHGVGHESDEDDD